MRQYGSRASFCLRLPSNHFSIYRNYRKSDSRDWQPRLPTRRVDYRNFRKRGANSRPRSTGYASINPPRQQHNFSYVRVKHYC